MSLGGALTTACADCGRVLAVVGLVLVSIVVIVEGMAVEVTVLVVARVAGSVEASAVVDSRRLPSLILRRMAAFNRCRLITESRRLDFSTTS